MPTLYCSYAYKHLFINNGGLVNTCCIEYPQYDYDQRQFNSVENKTIRSAINSNLNENIKAQFESGIWPSRCQTCKIEEDLGGQSRRRTYSNFAVGNDLTREILTMDLRLGNICNLACRMCSPFSSQKLQREWMNSSNEDLKNIAEHSSKISSFRWAEMTEKWDEIYLLSERVRLINFAGGEPFINNAHVGFLNKLIASGRSSEIELTYNTNLTVVPDWLSNVAANFKSVLVQISMDGTGKFNDYIRYPSKWEQFEINLDQIDKLITNNPNLSVGFATTVQIYNILHLSDLFLYFANHKFKNLPRTTFPNIVYNPDYFNAAHLPETIKAAALSKLKKVVESTSNDQALPFVEKVEKHLGLKENLEIISEFIKITDFYDKNRNQSFKDLDPTLWTALANISSAKFKI